MKNLLYLFFLSLLILSCTSESKKTSITATITPTFTNFSIKSSIRAIEAIDDQKVWFAGSNGLVGHTKDGGTTWDIDTISHKDKPLEFRSIVVTADAVFILSVASPALLYRSQNEGQTWELVYEDSDSLAFYNAMTFWNGKEGIAVGDPQEGCLSVIKTQDGGETWTKIDCDVLPATADGEAGFAASNTNVVVQGDHVWLVSGGKKARVFHSRDRGQSWEVFETPIVQGGKMTGIFSAAFYDANIGVIIGGDWENKEQNSQNKAITKDGGKTWTLMNDGANPDYRSCIQFLPNSNGQAMIAVGIPGISYSADFGETWQSVNKESYYTIRMVDENTAWLAGNEKIAKMEF